MVLSSKTTDLYRSSHCFIISFSNFAVFNLLFAFFNYAAFSRLKVRATLLLSEKTSKEKHGFVAFIKQQVENAEVRQEAKLLLIDLIIRTGLKVSIGQWMLRTDDFTVVGPLHEIISDSIGRYQSGFVVSSAVESGNLMYSSVRLNVGWISNSSHIFSVMARS